ncbi:MAG: glycerophosphodiester phosphodiesterase family protein [Candidatus Heimdallarchaeota archaeon]
MDTPTNEPTKKIAERIWFAFFVVFTLNIAVFTLITMLMQPLWYDVNEFLISMLNVEFNWLVLIIVLTFLVLGYGLYLVIYHLIMLIKKRKALPHLANRIIPFPLILIWNGMLILLIMEAGSELSLVRTQLEHISPILILFLILAVSAAAVFLLPKITDLWGKAKVYIGLYQKETRKIWNPRSKAIIVTISLIVIYLGFLIMPFTFTPSNVVQGSLPDKPQLIAHRGASHLAPENTIAAGELAVKWGAVGWEIDITISNDGVIFMIHDSTLERTTNIAEVFPGRISDRADSFNMADLLLLDAGSWFVNQDPFDTIKDGYVTQTESDSYIGEKIPTLAEAINFTRDNNLILDVDSKGPSSSHPYYATYEDILLDQLNASGLGKDILVGSSKPLADTMTRVCGPVCPCDMYSLGCDLINTQHGLTNAQFKEYQEENVSVMVWTVDSPSRFSQLWCLGVDFVKTNDLHVLSVIEKPSWFLTRRNYYLGWSQLNISIVIISVITYFLLKRRKTF